jgi:hypothetical protein
LQAPNVAIVWDVTALRTIPSMVPVVFYALGSFQTGKTG